MSIISARTSESGCRVPRATGAAVRLRVDGYLRGTVVVERLAQGVDFLGGECLEFVEWSADSALFHRGRGPEIVEESVDFSFFAQIFYA